MGSTTGIARAIGDEIRAGGAVVHVLPVNQVGAVEKYRSVIVGSPLYDGRWLEPVTLFMEHHREFLSKIPVALFAVTAYPRENADDRLLRVRRYLDPMLQKSPEIKPVAVGIFTGAFNSRQWALPTLLAYKAKDELPPDGDYRDWAAIRAWARHVRPYLIQHRAAAGM
jgi:menaquinone-dependent protoporphyrinogen oxidase